MSEKYYVCWGAKACGKLFIGTAPDKCPECGNTEFKQGLENLGYRAKQELAAIRRAEANDKVKKTYQLKPRRKR
jgi:hypothetical protein